jgi:hypothetical protein
MAFCLAQAQNTVKFNPEIGSPKAKINDVSWIAGHWLGEAFGGIIEEIWSPPLGNSMMCAFKLVVNNNIEFYELVTISEENETLVLRLKHFDHLLKGWEEKDEAIEFQLVKLEENRAFFNNFTFEKVNPNELNIYVVFKSDSEGETEMKFHYKLKQ